MRYTDLCPDSPPGGTAAAQFGSPVPVASGSGRTRRLTCFQRNSPGREKLRGGSVADAEEVARSGRAGSRLLLLGSRAPVGAVLACLGQHVREHSEAEAV